MVLPIFKMFFFSKRKLMKMQISEKSSIKRTR